MTKLSLAESNLITGRQHRWWLQQRGRRWKYEVRCDNFILAFILKSLFKFAAIKLVQTSPSTERNRLIRKIIELGLSSNVELWRTESCFQSCQLSCFNCFPNRLRARLKTLFVVMTAKTKGSLVSKRAN